MLNYILLQAADAAAQQQGTGWSFWIMMILIFVVFYFFMIRPQTKQQKELQARREAIKKGDKVVTAGGIHGEVKEVQESTFLIEVSKGMLLKVEKNSVDVLPAPAPAKEEKKDEKPAKKEKKDEKTAKKEKKEEETKREKDEK